MDRQSFCTVLAIGWCTTQHYFSDYAVVRLCNAIPAKAAFRNWVRATTPAKKKAAGAGVRTHAIFSASLSTIFAVHLP